MPPRHAVTDTHLSADEQIRAVVTDDAGHFVHAAVLVVGLVNVEASGAPPP